MAAVGPLPSPLLVRCHRRAHATLAGAHPSDDEWARAEAFALALWSGAPDPLSAALGASEARLLWDEDALHARGEIAFSTLHLDERPRGEGKPHGLWDFDVVELFCSRGPEPLPYGEVEGSPRGQLLDYLIERPRVVVDRQWSSEARVRALVGAPSANRFTVELALPWRTLGVRPVPGAGTMLRANVYAAQGPPGARRFLALSPTGTATPDFHVPERFARLLLVAG